MTNQSIFIALAILFIHFIADYPMQHATWAETKYKNWSNLLKHTMVYTLITMFLWTRFVSPFVTLNTFLMLGVITFIIHTIQDAITSRITHHLADQKKWGVGLPNMGFFFVLGVDQTLHFTQLFLMYKYLYL
jgi:hypothetical protein